jgi:hypothetical protein
MHAMDAPGARRDTPHARRRFSAWGIAFAVLALAVAVPIASDAYEKLVRVNQQARERLVLEHRLWELQPGFRGKPETWARFASRLLNDRQLLSRVAAKYGAASEQIELEYRRDLAIARAEVVVIALAGWAAPLGLLYAIAWVLRRRKPAPRPKKQPASASDPRYRRPDA